MQIETRWLRWHDEGRPQVASGLRLTEIKVGRKWVHVREAHEPRPVGWKRINRKVFEEMFG